MHDGSDSTVATPLTNPEFTVVAIIAAYNEGDIIEQVVRHLVTQGVDVYLLDHCSTDDTVAQLRPYLGRGLLHIERFPDDIGWPPGDASRFVWEKILRRKEALAQTLDATWFMHHDADEFRESPLAHLNLREAIRTVDQLGYNAIDLELLDFWPTHNNFDRGVDVRDAFRYYKPGEEFNKPQIRCWKKTANPVDLASSGGHDAIFAGRRVFPIRFILRHYPIRSDAHGRRKVLQERQPRFVEAERRKRWHIQYDTLGTNHGFLHEPSSMLPYDPEAVRLHLLLNHRGVEDAVERLNATVEEVERVRGELKTTIEGRERLEREVEEVKLERDTSNQEVERLRGRLTITIEGLERLNRKVEEVKLERDRSTQEVECLTGKVAEVERERDRSNQELERLRGQMTYMLGSRSWRLTAPLRGIWGSLRRLR